MRPVLLALVLPTLAFCQGGPRIRVDVPRFDLGKVMRDTVVKHGYKVSNAGDATLRILSVEASCGCTSTVVGARELEPGQSTEVEVALDTNGMGGAAHKSVKVVTNDPERPEVQLFLDAEVAPRVRVSASSWHVGNLTPKDRRSFTVELASETGHPIDLAGLDMSPASWLGVRTREVEGKVFLDLDLAARNLPREKASGLDTVVLHVSNPDPSDVRFELHWAWKPKVTATPERLALEGKAGEEAGGSVLLERVDHKPFSVKDLRVSNPRIYAEVVTPLQSRRQELRVHFTPGTPAGVYDERVFLAFDRAREPEVEIRVSAVLR